MADPGPGEDKQYPGSIALSPPPPPFTPRSAPTIDPARAVNRRSSSAAGCDDGSDENRDDVGSVIQRFARKNPLLFKMIVSSTSGALGELLSQKIKTGVIKLQRNTGAYFLCGGLFVAPFFHKWYPFLDQVLVPKGSKYPVFQKLMIDRLLVSPPFNVVYMMLLALFNGNSVSEGMSIVRTNILNVVKKSFQFWAVVNCFSYSQVPVELRAYFGNLMGLVWTTYLALSTRAAK